MKKVFFCYIFVLVFSVSQSVLTLAGVELPGIDSYPRLAMGTSPQRFELQEPPQSPQQPRSVQPSEPVSQLQQASSPQPQPNNFFVPTVPVTQPVTPVPGQQPVQPVPQARSQPAQLPAKEPAVKKGESSFNFDDVDVFSVIQTIFGDILKVNYIIDPRVKGRVNFRSVVPVAKKEILPLMEVILRLNGIGIVEEGGLYRIVPISDISKEPASVGVGREPEEVKITGKALVQVVPVRYIQSSEMVRVLAPFLSKNAVIVDVPKSNYIIIVDTDANVKRLLQLVEIFDSEQLKQITPRVFVYSVQNSKAGDIANMLQQIFLGGKSRTPVRPVRTTKTGAPAATQRKTKPQISIGVTAGEMLVSGYTRIIPDEVTNSIIVLSTPEDYALIADAIKKIDIVPRQVMIEALIAEVTLEDELQYGIEWFLKSKLAINNTSLSGFNVFGDRPSALPSFDLTNPLGQSGFTFAAIDSAGLIRGLLQALSSKSNLNILSSPHILVSDNREAKIQVGDQVPIVTSETNVSGTTNIQRTIQYKDTGVILKVKPQINESGLVSLEITQEVSKATRDLAAGIETTTISTRRTETHLIAQDGQSIVLGGLIEEQKENTRGGIPILSDIPILGYFFGYKKSTSKKTELVVIITPHVVSSIDQAGIMSDEFRKKLEGINNILNPDAQKIPPEGQETEDTP